MDRPQRPGSEAGGAAEAAPARARRVLFAAVLGLGITLFWTVHIAFSGTELPAFGDTFLQFYPLYLGAARVWGAGELPLWNPYQLCGIPWIATLQGGVLYPGHLAYLLLPGGVAMAALGLVHLLLAGGAMALLARRLGMGVAPALLAAALVTMRGRLTWQLGTPNMIEAGAWLAPGALAVWALTRGRPSQLAPATGGLALCTGASLLAGYPQYSVYLVYAWAAFGLVLLCAGRAPLARWRRAGLGFAGGVALGGLVAAAQLLPSMELAAEAVRNLDRLSLKDMFPYGLRGDSIVSALSVLLSPDEERLPLGFGWVGLVLLPLALAPVGLRGRVPLAAGLLLLGGLALVIAAGPVSPLFDLYRALPATGSFREPGPRLLLVTDFFFALVAALGLDAVRRLQTRFSGGVAGTGTLLAVAVLFVALLELFGRQPTRPRLPYFGSDFDRIYTSERPSYEPVARSAERTLLWNPGPKPLLPSKLGSVQELRVIDDYEPMNLRRQAEYFTYLVRGSTRTRRQGAFFGRLALPRTREEGRDFASRQRLLDLASVRFVLAPRALRREPGLQGYTRNAALDRVASGAGEQREDLEPPDGHPDPRSRAVVAWRNPRALPRAYVSYRALPAPPPAELLPLLAHPDFDPLAEIFVEGIEVDSGVQAAPPGHSATITRDESARVEVEADLAEPGWLVLTDTIYPGWQATVDGEPAAILPANHLFRGVRLPAGRHQVRFAYRPRWMAAGVAASAAGLLAAVSLVVGGWLRARGRRTPG